MKPTDLKFCTKLNECLIFMLFRSGTEEEYSEKCQLLEEICELMESGKEILEEKKKNKKKAEEEAKKKLSLKRKGEDIRLKAMQTLKGH